MTLNTLNSEVNKKCFFKRKKHIISFICRHVLQFYNTYLQVISEFNLFDLSDKRLWECSSDMDNYVKSIHSILISLQCAECIFGRS